MPARAPIGAPRFARRASRAAQKHREFRRRSRPTERRALGDKGPSVIDTLPLRTRDGQEYLVVGTLIPPTVNVISHTQEIAFSELVSRLERIQKSEKAQKSAH
jgi:hypothetical protein